MARKRRSDKKKRYNRCKRKKAKYDGVTVVLPCRATKLTAKHKALIDDEYTQAAWNSCKKVAKKSDESCRVVFFKATQPVMRKSTRKLSTPAKKRSRRAQVRKQCRYSKRAPKGKRGRFRAC